MSKPLHAALGLLARREHSAVELRQKLSRLGYTSDEIADTLATCQAQGYQNDARFGALCCRVRIEQGYGPLKITAMLKQHGLPHELIQQCYEAEQVDWVQLASKVLQKHHWRFNSSQSSAKQMRFLMARGFPVDVIRLSLKERSVYEDR